MIDPKKYSDKVKANLTQLLISCEKEDEYTRTRMLREAKQNDLYWHGFQYIFWDQSVGDFRIPTHEVMESLSTREDTKLIYDYVVNVFKAHGLSIIAALSAEVPGVPFAPMDAESMEDLRAARKAESLGKIISKQNKTKLIFYQALFTLYTQHYCVAYNYYQRDKKYGIVQIPKYETQDVKTGIDKTVCSDPSCAAESEELLNQCPNCGADTEFQEGATEKLPQQIGTEDKNKGQEKIDVSGTLNYKIPIYAADQDACGYVIKYSDQHFSYLRYLFPELPKEIFNARTSSDSYEKISRMQTVGKVFSDSYLTSLLTFKQVWFRPSLFFSLEIQEDIDELVKLFPDGCYVAFIEDSFAEARPEKLDDHLTITKGDLSRSVHGDPLGKPLIPLQDLENNIMNLMVESVEHSVPSTFADPEILDFEAYSQQEVSPGAVYPAKTPINSTKRLQDYFYDLKTSTLPAEAVNFGGIVDSKSQFVVGAFPSIFGGPQTEGSKTLGEYQESRSYALQRLSIPYQLLYFWWADVVHKCVLDYISNMLDDETHVVPGTDSGFVNQRFLQSDFIDGKFAQLLPESSLDLPVSFGQKRATLQQMIQLNNETLNTFLFSPENRRVVFRFLGIEEMSDLDSNQAIKQLRELDDLIVGTPQQSQQTGEQQSSVPIEPQIDDDAIHLRVIRNFLSSEVGQDVKKSNPGGYLNALLHAKEHQMNMMMLAQVNPMGDSANQATNQPVKSPGSSGSSGPIVKAPASNGSGASNGAVNG